VCLGSWLTNSYLLTHCHSGSNIPPSSACYGGKKDWASAASDAKECIKVNPTFIKGYYRLATAQSEQQEFNAALATIKQGLAIEPDNAQLQTQLRLIKANQSTTKRTETQAKCTTASSATANTSYHNLNPAIQKEVIDLQQQLMSTTREYCTVKAHILHAQKEKRSNELIKSELDKLPPSNLEVKMYRSIRKMFMLTPRSEVMTHLVTLSKGRVRLKLI
jgi:predicted O-linked N-acetylglucosamine transferase (SPINDLY family)